MVSKVILRDIAIKCAYTMYRFNSTKITLSVFGRKFRAFDSHFWFWKIELVCTLLEGFQTTFLVSLIEPCQCIEWTNLFCISSLSCARLILLRTVLRNRLRCLTYACHMQSQITIIFSLMSWKQVVKNLSWNSVEYVKSADCFIIESKKIARRNKKKSY